MGLTGYLLLLIYDVATLKLVRKRSILAVLGYGIHLYAIILTIIGEQKLSFPSWLVWAGLPVALSGGVWLVYCLFLFSPIKDTYMDRGKPLLTTEGPYALTRHPGVLGYAVMIAGLTMISRSSLLLVGGIIWIAGNVLYVYIQECLIFRRLFPGYENYCRQVPMLVPRVQNVIMFFEYYKSQQRR
ncbi:MAG: methyltransferase family protein [Bacillota bacterium]